MEKSKKHASTAEKETASSRGQAEHALGLALQHLERYLGALGTDEAPPISQKEAKLAGELGQRAAAIVAELRKSELAAQKQNADITRPRVVAWARQLTKDERRLLVREVVSIDETRNVLS
jgi:hypothetical protein